MRNKSLILMPILAILMLHCNGESYPEGKRLYTNYCSNCHMENGEGLRNLIPPLAQSDYLMEHQKELPCLIRNGMDTLIIVNGIPFEYPMPGVEVLNEVEIANIINYINSAWGNEGDFVKLQEVIQGLKECPSLEDEYFNRKE